MDCKGFKEKLGKYIDGTLHPDEAESFNKHLENCEDCKVFMHKFMGLWNKVETFDSIEPSPYFKTRVKGRLLEMQRSSEINRGWFELLFTRLKPVITVVIVLIGVFVGYTLGSRLYPRQIAQETESARETELNQFVNSQYIYVLDEFQAVSPERYYTNLNSTQ